MKEPIDPLHSFARLPSDIETCLQKMLRVRNFMAEEVIFFQDDEPGSVYLVASGRVKVVRVTQEGYESILCVRGPRFFQPCGWIPLLAQAMIPV